MFDALSTQGYNTVWYLSLWSMTTPSVLLIYFSLPVSESIMSHHSASSLRTLWILQKCYATHKTVNVSSPAGVLITFKEFIEAAFGSAPDFRNVASPNSSNCARYLDIPPRLHIAVPGPRSYKKTPLGQMQSDCLTFLKCSDRDVWIAESKCLVGLCSGWRHRCLSQRNSTSSIVLSDRRVWRHLCSLREASWWTTVCVLICIGTTFPNSLCIRVCIFFAVYIHSPCVRFHLAYVSGVFCEEQMLCDAGDHSAPVAGSLL